MASDLRPSEVADVIRFRWISDPVSEDQLAILKPAQRDHFPPREPFPVVDQQSPNQQSPNLQISVWDYSAWTSTSRTFQCLWRQTFAAWTEMDGFHQLQHAITLLSLLLLLLSLLLACFANPSKEFPTLHESIVYIH